MHVQLSTTHLNCSNKNTLHAFSTVYYIQCILICVSLCVSLSELWNDELSGRKKRRDALSPDKKKRRPSVVSDILLLLLFILTLPSISTYTASINSLYWYLDVSLYSDFNPFLLALSLTPLTSIYCLHAAWLGHPGGLDSYQKGVQMCQLSCVFVPCWR